MKTPFAAPFLFYAAVMALAVARPSLAANTATNVPPPGPYQIVERGASFNIWERQVYEQTPSGEVVARPHRYTQLGSGLNFWQNNAWTPSVERVDPLPTGGAAATNGPCQVFFPDDIYQGVIELVTPEGLHLRGRPMGISYCDGSNNVLIAELTNSVGQILPSGNQVIYTNAFSDVAADLLLTYRKSGLECDVVFREIPPSPTVFSLSPDQVRVQVISEFFDTADPVPESTMTDPDEGLTDSTLRFGTLRMIRGKAFSAGDPAQPSARALQSLGSPAEERPEVPVYKSWQKIDNRKFLIEEVPYPRPPHYSTSWLGLPGPLRPSLEPERALVGSPPRAS